jgi:hypothetical protein
VSKRFIETLKSSHPVAGVSEMKRFVQGDNRTQSFLLPEALDDYVTDTNPVRVVDVFVDELDLRKLGFA